MFDQGEEVDYHQTPTSPTPQRRGMPSPEDRLRVFGYVYINIITKNFVRIIDLYCPSQNIIDYECPSIGIVRSSYNQHLERNLSSHLKLVTEKVKVTNSTYLTSSKHIFPLKQYLSLRFYLIIIRNRLNLKISIN